MESLEQQEVFEGVQLGAEEPQFSSRKDRSDTRLGDEGRIISRGGEDAGHVLSDRAQTRERGRAEGVQDQKLVADEHCRM